MLSDEAFANELLQMEEPENVQEALAEKEIELSLDEICQMGALLQKVQNGELTQEQVQAMADGFVLIGIISSLIAGAIISGVAASCLLRW